MTASDHLKQAAQNLRHAAQTMQQGVQDLRNRLSQTERDMHNQISEIERAIKNNNIFMGRQDASDGERVNRLRQNGKMDSEIVDKKHELASLKDQTNEEIKAIERNVQQLNNQASQVESQTSGGSFLNI